MIRHQPAIALPTDTGRAIAAVARRAEERGFDALVGLAGGEHDALVTPAFAAAATETERFPARVRRCGAGS